MPIVAATMVYAAAVTATSGDNSGSGSGSNGSGSGSNSNSKGYFAVDSSSAHTCSVTHGGRCVSSYTVSPFDAERCEIRVLRRTTLTVGAWQRSAASSSALTVDNTQYSGATAPDGVVVTPGAQLVWSSPVSTFGTAFELCAAVGSICDLSTNLTHVRAPYHGAASFTAVSAPPSSCGTAADSRKLFAVDVPAHHTFDLQYTAVGGTAGGRVAVSLAEDNAALCTDNGGGGDCPVPPGRSGFSASAAAHWFNPDPRSRTVLVTVLSQAAGLHSFDLSWSLVAPPAPTPAPTAPTSLAPVTQAPTAAPTTPQYFRLHPGGGCTLSDSGLCFGDEPSDKTSCIVDVLVSTAVRFVVWPGYHDGQFKIHHPSGGESRLEMGSTLIQGPRPVTVQLAAGTRIVYNLKGHQNGLGGDDQVGPQETNDDKDQDDIGVDDFIDNNNGNGVEYDDEIIMPAFKVCAGPYSAVFEVTSSVPTLQCRVLPGGLCIANNGVGENTVERCHFNVTEDAHLAVAKWSVDTCCDAIEINGKTFTGADTPDGVHVHPGDHIQWVSSGNGGGFTMCSTQSEGAPFLQTEDSTVFSWGAAGVVTPLGDGNDDGEDPQCCAVNMVENRWCFASSAAASSSCSCAAVVQRDVVVDTAQTQVVTYGPGGNLTVGGVSYRTKPPPQLVLRQGEEILFVHPSLDRRARRDGLAYFSLCVNSSAAVSPAPLTAEPTPHKTASPWTARPTSAAPSRDHQTSAAPSKRQTPEPIVPTAVPSDRPAPPTSAAPTFGVAPSRDHRISAAPTERQPPSPIAPTAVPSHMPARPTSAAPSIDHRTTSPTSAPSPPRRSEAPNVVPHRSTQLPTTQPTTPPTPQKHVTPTTLPPTTGRPSATAAPSGSGRPTARPTAGFVVAPTSTTRSTSTAAPVSAASGSGSSSSLAPPPVWLWPVVAVGVGACLGVAGAFFWRRRGETSLLDAPIELTALPDPFAEPPASRQSGGRARVYEDEFFKL
mmetsp:Transcript_26899/g.70675  ORF Transcript_26899/g.70675 Transcript_26899/m.70675 type:complete len:990 (-) Transcript_26899:146-3115(-)